MEVSSSKAADGNNLEAVELLASIGYIAFFSGFLLIAFQITGGNQTVFSLPQNQFLGLLFFAGMFAAAIAFRIITTKWNAVIFKPPIVIIITACTAIIALLHLVETNQDSFTIVIFGVCHFIAGIACFYFFMAWDNCGAHIASNRFIRFLGIAICVGDALCLFTLLALNFNYQCIIACIFILLSGGLLTYIYSTADVLPTSKPSDTSTNEPVDETDVLRNEPLLNTENIENAGRKKTEEKSSNEGIDSRISVLFFLFNTAFGAAWVLLILSSSSGLMFVLIAGLLMAGITLVVQRRDPVMHDRYVTFLMRACMAVIPIVFALVLFFTLIFSNEAVVIVCLVLLCAGWQIFWIMDAGLIVRHAVKNQFLLPQYMRIGKISNSGGFFLGMLLASLLVLALPFQNALAATAVIVIVATLLASMMLFPFENRKSPNKQEENPPASDKVESAPNLASTLVTTETEAVCNNMAETYDLSQREAEILVFLVRGRNAKFISNSLVISEYTVKTHVYNIYKKMDIHSRSELFELYEEFLHKQEDVTTAQPISLTAD